MSISTYLCQQLVKEFHILSEMNILPTNRLIFNWFCICPFGDGTLLKHKMLAVLLSVFVVFSDICILISSIMFVFINIEIDVTKSMYAGTQIFTFTCAILALTNGFINRRQIGEIFIKIKKIYDGT